MTRHEFLNRVRSMGNIDRDQLPELTDDQWRSFRADPFQYLKAAEDSQADAIFREVEKRQ